MSVKNCMLFTCLALLHITHHLICIHLHSHHDHHHHYHRLQFQITKKGRGNPFLFLTEQNAVKSNTNECRCKKKRETKFVHFDRPFPFCSLFPFPHSTAFFHFLHVNHLKKHGTGYFQIATALHILYFPCFFSLFHQ